MRNRKKKFALFDLFCIYLRRKMNLCLARGVLAGVRL